MSIETKFHVEIDNELEALDSTKKGSEEYKAIVDGIVKLTDRAIEFEKLAMEEEEKKEARKREEEDRKREYELKLQQMAEQRKDRWINLGLTAAGIILPLWMTRWGIIRSLEFEKEGTITTVMGNGLFRNLIPNLRKK